MRILMIAHSDATWTMYFARFFRGRGHQVKVLSMAPGTIEGIDVDFIGTEPYDRFRNKSLFFTRLPRIRRIIRRYRPDLLFAPYLSSNGLSAALVWSGPLVVSAVGGDVLNHARRRGLRRWLRERVIRFVCGRAGLINTVSTGLTEELRRLGVPRDKLMQLPFGVDTDLFRPHPDMPRRNAVKIISTRKHEAIYDIPTIIQSLARLRGDGRPFHCTFTSSGSLLEAHRRLAHRVGLDNHVTFTGQLDHGMLSGLLREADVYISAAHGDGTSVALLEAMASGLFPVVTDISANRPWVRHGETGLLFERGNAAGLAVSLRTALDDESLRRRAFEDNRKRVESDASMTRNMERLLGRFEALVSSRNRS